MTDKTRVLQYGLGPIGCAMARLVLERPGLELVGGIDIDPAKVGRDLGEVLGLGSPLGVPLVRTIADALGQAPADVALHTTQSYFRLVKSQILGILEAKVHVVSTSEELVFPWLDHPQDAAEVDDAARRAGKTVLATGINPGFVMDTLPLVLTGICHRVERIEVRRVVNASTRRAPFQAKIGSGLTVEEFRSRVEAGRMGHVGLRESAGMILEGLGMQLVRFESSTEPILADRSVRTEAFEVQPGRVIGLRQTAQAHTQRGEFLTLTFIAALDVEDEGDVIKISGKPDVEVTLKGSHGDLATAAIAVNCIRMLKDTPPGLLTMRDLPVVSFRS